MDITDLQGNIEDNYYVSSFFSVEVQYNLQPLIDHRINLVLKHNVIFHAGESQNVETSCILDIKQTKLSLTLKSYEYLPVTFESEGSISS